MSSASAGWTIIIGTILFGAVAMAFLLTWLKHHELVIRDTINRNNAFIRKYWIIEKKDKDTGTMYWVSVWGKNTLKTPKPPASAINVMKRGKKYAEAYRVSEDEFIWISDNGIVMEEIEDKDGVKKKVIREVLMDGTQRTVDTFKPFGAVPREVLVSQHRKAAEIRSKRWTADKIINIASIASLSIIFIFAIIYWGEMMQPVKDMYAMNEAREVRLQQHEKQILEIANRCGGVSQDLQQQLPNTLIQPGETPPS